MTTPELRTARALLAAALLAGFGGSVIAFAAAPPAVKGTTVPHGARRAAPAVQARHGFSGHWEGAIILFGSPLAIAVDAAAGGDSVRATIDIPSQGVSQLVLQDVRAHADSIAFVLRVTGTEASFAGVQRGDSVSGTFRQAGITAPFRLARGAAIQHPPEPPVPYVREDVRYTSGAITLAGTLTRPHGAGPFPAVLLVSGSGPQNRDEELFGFKPFALIADHLTRHGIAVLRVDDRGVGGSTGDFVTATSVDFAADARAGLRYLSRSPHVDRRRLGLIGHSEGGLIGPMVAADNDSVAFLVLLAPPGLRGDSILRIQGERISAVNGADDSLRAMNSRTQAMLIRAAETGAGWDDARDATRATLRRAYARAGVAIDSSALGAAVEAQVRMMSGTWMRYYLTADPAVVLVRVRCPVLVLFGGQDLQVPPDVNAPPIERALAQAGNRDVTVRVLPRANHLFQQTDSGNPALYPTLEKAFVPGLLDTLTSWTVARTHARR
jgi:pimeloyl-ACP methyl ester carboxylesterase